MDGKKVVRKFPNKSINKVVSEIKYVVIKNITIKDKEYKNK